MNTWHAGLPLRLLAFAAMLYLFSVVPTSCWAQATTSARTVAASMGEALAEDGIAKFNARRYADAAHSLLRALPFYLAKYGANHEETLALERAFRSALEHTEVLARLNVGLLRKPREGLELQRQAVELRKLWQGAQHPETLDAMDQLSQFEYYEGNHQQALAVAKQSLAIRRATVGDLNPATWKTMRHLAAAYSMTGKKDLAANLVEQIFRYQQAALGRAHIETLETSVQLSRLYGATGRRDEALVLAKDAVQELTTQLGSEHATTRAAASTLAIAEHALGNADSALKGMKQALEDALKSKNPLRTPEQAISEFNLGDLYRLQGRVDLALPMMERSLGWLQRRYSVDHVGLLMPLSRLGSAYRADGKLDKALEIGRRAYEISLAKLGLHNETTLNAIDSLAATYVALGDSQSAIAMSRDLVNSVEGLRKLPGFTAEQRQEKFEVYATIYQKISRFYAQEGLTGEAFILNDLAKARTLNEGIQQGNAIAALPTRYREAIRQSNDRAARLMRDFHLLSNRPDASAAQLLSARQQTDAHAQAHASLVAQIIDDEPKYGLLNSTTPITVNEAAASLGEAEAFISFGIGHNGATQVFVLDRTGRLEWRDLGTLANLGSTVDAYRRLVLTRRPDLSEGKLVRLQEGGFDWLAASQAVPPGAVQVETNASSALRILDGYWFTSIVEPLLSIVPSTLTRWAISPDNALALLPFDMLPASKPSAYQPVAALMESRNISIIQGLSVYRVLKQRGRDNMPPRWKKDLLAIGNPVYQEGWTASAGESDIERVMSLPFRPTSSSKPNNYTSPAAEQVDLQRRIWSNLPGTARETTLITRNFRSNGLSADVLTGMEASEEKVSDLSSQGVLRDYRYVLFSTHGLAARHPANSAVVLNQVGNRSGYDGLLSASELPQLNMRSDLVVISACDTATGQVRGGEGIMGLPYALLIAGNKNTLLTLWAVDDAATSEFIVRFFSRLITSGDQRQALAETKREFARHPRWSSGRFWAAFVLYGV